MEKKLWRILGVQVLDFEMDFFGGDKLIFLLRRKWKVELDSDTFQDELINQFYYLRHTLL